MRPNAKPSARPKASPNLNDYRLYPKGSPERKAAIAAMQRAHAAKIRRRPGASRRGIKKAVTDAERGVELESRVLTPEEQARLRQAGYREIVAWVIECIDEPKCPGGATGMPQVLWQAAQEDK